MIIHHITLITGNSVAHRLDMITPEAVAVCRRIIEAGKTTIPNFPAYRVEVADKAFSIFRGKEPLVTCAVGSGPSEDWQTLVDLQQRFAPVKATRAPAGRWLCVVMYPFLAMTPQSDIEWLADFERCMAAAMLMD